MTPKQQRFVDEYLIDLNATQAAIRAGYSARAAAVTGLRMLRDAKIAAAIAEQQQARSERTQITQDQVLTELLILLKSDVRDFDVDDTGQLTLRDGAADAAWRAVSSVKHRITTRGKGDDAETVREIEFRLWDKNAALKMAGQHLGMFVERHEHTGTDGTPIAHSLTVHFVRPGEP